MTEITKTSYPIEVEKIKAINPHIVVNNNVEDPYYSSCYYDIAKKDWYTGGFGSYDLKDVVKWLNECFEVVEADVEPVKHGEWKYIKSGEGVFDYYFECSECHASTPDKAYPTNPNFCPHCGSKNVSLDCGICCLNYKGGKEVQE